MSTNGFIGYVHEDNTITVSYCQHDCAASGATAADLLRWFDTPERAKLIASWGYLDNTGPVTEAELTAYQDELEQHGYARDDFPRQTLTAQREALKKRRRAEQLGTVPLAEPFRISAYTTSWRYTFDEALLKFRRTTADGFFFWRDGDWYFTSNTGIYPEPVRLKDVFE